MKALLLKRFLSSFILLTSLLLSTITFGQAALMSDLSDYDPGSTCTLTGTGFLPGETVHIRVLHSIDHPEDYTGVEHEPWSVTADSTGNFVTTWQVSDSHCIGKLLKATAIGQSSGENVWTEFTDPTKTSTSIGGNWNVGSTWVGGSVPLSTDDVVIAVGATVTVTDNRTAKSITIAGGSSDTELRINSGITLAVSGDVTINSPGSNNRDSEITVGSGILNIGGNLTVNGTTSGNSRRGRLTVSTGSVDVNGNITTNAAGSNALISFSNNGTLNVGGNWTHDGAFTKSTSTVTFDGTTQSISGGVALDFNIFTIASSSTTTANTAPLASIFNINGNGKYIQKTGSVVPGTTRNFAPTSTYEWQSGGGVNFPSTSGIAFGNLTINSTSGNNSAGGNLTTVNGDLYIQNTTGGSYRIASSTSPTLTIGGDLQIDGGTLNFSTGSGSPTVNVTGNVLINGGTLQPMTSTGVPVFRVTGNWTNNAAYTAGSETVTFNGGSQTIGGSNPTIFGGLTIAGSEDKTLGKDITVNNTLSLSDKKINTGTNVLTANSITRTTGFIVGNLRKGFTSSTLSHTFDVGQTLYAPVSVAFSSVTTSGFLTARTDDGEHGDIGTSTLDPFNSINRNWTVTKDASLGHGNYNLTLTYNNPADHDGGTTPSSFKIGKFNSGDPTPWTYPTISGTPTATSITATGLTGFSSFAVASSCANPVVIDNPDDATKCVGESVSFSVVATFPGIATYTWRKGGVAIVGAPNSSTYTIPSVAIGDAGSYDVVITRPCGGTATSSIASLTVNIPTTITTQPTNQTVTYGNNAGFSVVGSGSGTLGYQWQLSTDNGSNFSDIPSAIHPTLDVNLPTVLMNGYKYRVMVSGICGNVISDEVTLTVNKADATIIVNSYTGVYDGNTHGASGSATGVLGEDLSANLSLGSTFTDVPGGTANWTFTGGTNYNDDSGSVAINIGKADATIIVNGYTGVYDGNTHGASGSATGVLGEDLSANLSLGNTFTDVPGGAANWTFSGGTNYNDDSGSVAINISKADATIIVNGYTDVYDGNTHGASGSATGVLGEDLSANLSLGSTFTDVPGGTANWTFSGGMNYNDDSGSVAINISKADATIIVNGYTGTYDGNAHGASGSATGVLGEDLSASLSLGSTFTDVPGGTANWTFTGGTNYNDDSGSVAINISKADAVISVNGYTGTYDGNAHGASGSATGVLGEDLSANLYLGSTFTDVPGGTANWTFTGGTNYNDDSGSVAINISKADAVISVNGYTGTYDGNAHGASGSATGVLGEDLSASLSLGNTFTDVPGGTANWTFTGGTNYNDDSGSVAINISKADATIIVNGYSGVYDGNTHGASSSATGVLGEDLSANLSLGSTFTDVPGGTANWTFTGGTNYNDNSGSVAINISKADATIIVNGYTGTYDGNAHGVSGSATGVLGEDLSANLYLGSTFTDVPGGTANWTFSGGTNYNDDSGSVAINISKADATIIVNGYSGVYDGNAHGASGSATGVSGEDLSASLSLGSTFTDVPGGTANWTFTGGTNYNDNSGSVAINISKADATIIVNGYTGTYDGNAHGVSGSATGVLGEDLSANLYLGSTFTDVPGGTANWTFSGGTNYNDDSGSVAINISKADATIIVNGYSGVYDGNAHGASGSATGVSGEDLSASLSLGSTFTDVPGGTANWTFTGGTNYNDANGSVAISIGAKSVTVTAEAKSKIFGDPDPEFTYLLSESLLAGNALNGDLSRANGELAGNYAINQGDLQVSTSNYTITFVTADLTIIMPPPMSAIVAKTNITCNGSIDGTITVTSPTGGLGIYEYRLNTGAWQASGSFTNLSAGVYTVQMRDPVRTIFSADLGNQTIIEPSVLNAQTSKANVTCNGAANGSITILNPTGGSGSYEYRLNSDAWQSSPVFSGLAANTYTISMRDAVNQSCEKNLGTQTVSEPQALTATCTSSNNLLYFGYAGDQTSIINVKPSGGVGPYKVSITMNRPLKCNVVNNTGDEVWAPGSNTATNVDTSCPTTGTPSLLPISTSTFTINATVGYSLNVTLMADATFTATITDSNGCITTCTTTIMAEDVRCFSGNSTRPKVNICHKTGSTKNPCVSICVDDNAVTEHLAHGDFLGKCTSNCLDPNGTRSLEEETFNVKAYPNPSNSVFNLEIENGSEEEVAIEVFDISGRRIKQLNPLDIHAITFGEELPRGVYLVNVQQGSNSKTIRVVKE